MRLLLICLALAIACLVLFFGCKAVDNRTELVKSADKLARKERQKKGVGLPRR